MPYEDDDEFDPRFDDDPDNQAGQNDELIIDEPDGEAEDLAHQIIDDIDKQ